MEKDRFEILLERIESNNRLLVEGFEGLNRRQDRLGAAQVETNERLDRLEVAQVVTDKRLDRMEAAWAETGSRLDRMEAILEKNTERLDGHDLRFNSIDARLESMEAGQRELTRDVRDIKKSVDLLQAIASDHEGRVRSVENRRG